MNKTLLVLLAVPFLTAGSCSTLGGFIKPSPVPENCDAKCRLPCTVDPNIQYRGASPNESAFDELVRQVVIPLRGELDRCEVEHRQACVQCLDRIKAAGLTK